MEGDLRLHKLLYVIYISIHSLRMEGDARYTINAVGEIISIHSLRMEGDVDFHFFGSDHPNFNPLPPHGGRLDGGL